MFGARADVIQNTKTRNTKHSLVTSKSTLTRTRNIHRFAILGNRAASDGQAVLGELRNELIVTERIVLVFGVDHFLQLDAHCIPGDLFAVGRDRATAKEPSQRKDATRGLNPFVVDRSAHGGDVNSDLVGDLLHLERLDELGPFVQELGLKIDNGLRYLGQRIATLLDRLDQPLGRVELPLDPLPGLLGRLPAGEHLAVRGADEQVWQIAIFEPHAILAPFDHIEKHIRRHRRGVDRDEVGAGFGLSLRSSPSAS